MPTQITYSQHALERIAEQAILKEDVESALLNADATVPARLGRWNAYKDAFGWMLRVTFVLESGTIADPEAITVITVYAEQRT